MLKRTLIALTVMLATLPAFAQNNGTQKAAKIEFESTEHSLGTLRQKSQSVNYEYRFTNTGDAPLVITFAEVSCSCLKVKHPKKPIPPGEAGAIEVTYTPKEVGRFSNKIRVHTNDEDRLHILLIEGEVIKK